MLCFLIRYVGENAPKSISIFGFFLLIVVINHLQGQCCCAGSRTYVHESVYDEVLEKAKARAFKRSVGDPFMAGIEQGPQVNRQPFLHVSVLMSSDF